MIARCGQRQVTPRNVKLCSTMKEDIKLPSSVHTIFAFGANRPLAPALSLGSNLASEHARSMHSTIGVMIGIADGDDVVVYTLADGKRR